jgi:hypothetical protein
MRPYIIDGDGVSGSFSIADVASGWRGDSSDVIYPTPLPSRYLQATWQWNNEGNGGSMEIGGAVCHLCGQEKNK